MIDVMQVRGGPGLSALLGVGVAHRVPALAADRSDLSGVWRSYSDSVNREACRPRHRRVTAAMAGYAVRVTAADGTTF